MKKYNVSYQLWEERTIYGKTSPQSSITVTSVQHGNAKPKFATWNKSTKKAKNVDYTRKKMNATATLISISILQLTFEKFMQV